MVHDFFVDLYNDSQACSHNDDLDKDMFPLFSLKEFKHLSDPFIQDDVKKALFNIRPFKALGPNGFHAGFYQWFWNISGHSFLQVALSALNRQVLPLELNDTLLVIIPKAENLVCVIQLRPVSLCNVAYKVISKAIVDHLKPILPRLIAPTQCSFIPGRQITDNVAVVQKILHSLRRKKGNIDSMIIKLDLEKMYDR